MGKLLVNTDKASKADLIATVRFIDQVLRSKHQSSILELLGVKDDRDAFGMKWDARIHDEAKIKNHNGAWKGKLTSTREEITAVVDSQKTETAKAFEAEELKIAADKFNELEILITKGFKTGRITVENIESLKAEYCLPKLADARTNLTLINRLMLRIQELQHAIVST